MLNSRLTTYLTLIIGLITGLMVWTTPTLISKIRFGLEFRGGYEIYYVATPVNGKEKVTHEEMLATANILRQRADSIGMAEPEIHLEGENHIRLKMAGMTSSNESRSGLGNPEGLPTVLTEKYTQTVGSVLGNTALKDTLLAGALGVACIFLLLLSLYRGMGLLAAFCTVVYLWLLVIVFISFHATLSLSAVVAFVLGIGMAADASIICFERVREDLARGITKTDAVRLGFKESFMTIMDANLVTGLAMIALFVAGIGPIQGFSLTMLVSIIISIATNFFLLQFLGEMLAKSDLLSVDLLIGRGRAKKSVGSWNFLNAGRKTIYASILSIAAGALYYRAHGLNLDIDFTAGTALDIDLDQAITQDNATAIMTAAGIVPATVSIGGKDSEHIAARFDEVLKPEQLKAVIEAFKSKFSKVEYEENTADPGVARDFAFKAVYAILAAFIGIGLYIWFRFSWAVAVAILFGIVHDLLLVSAIFSLFKLEIDVTYIAALLTIMGYSLNDKIVIFGRIRENQKDGKPTSLSQLINFSINQTLGRSIYTVITVVLASACLFFFACEPLQMFSLAILLGLISGAYSSIFLSSLVWFKLQNKGEFMETEKSTQSEFVRSVKLVAGGAFTALFIAAWIAIPTLMTPAQTAVSAPKSSSVKAGPLGDLAPYEKIAKDTLKLVEAGKFSEAKSRITELESVWDQAEEKMQPMSPNDWRSVDKSIDRALAQVRSGKPDKEGCIGSLKTLIDKMQTLNPK